MRYLKYFENFGPRTIEVEVKELKGNSKKLNGQEYNYTLLIGGKLYYYHTFPFVKDQDNFEILSDNNGVIKVLIDKDTFMKNSGSKMTLELAEEMFHVLNTANVGKGEDEQVHADRILANMYKGVVSDEDISGVIQHWATNNDPIDVMDYWNLYKRLHGM